MRCKQSLDRPLKVKRPSNARVDTNGPQATSLLAPPLSRRRFPDAYPEIGIPIHSEDKILGTLSGCDGEAKVLCRQCGHTIVDHGSIENVLSSFWTWPASFAAISTPSRRTLSRSGENIPIRPAASAVTLSLSNATSSRNVLYLPEEVGTGWPLGLVSPLANPASLNADSNSPSPKRTLIQDSTSRCTRHTCSSSVVVWSMR